MSRRHELRFLTGNEQEKNKNDMAIYIDTF